MGTDHRMTFQRKIVEELFRSGHHLLDIIPREEIGY